MTQIKIKTFDSAPPTVVSDANAALRVALALGRALRDCVLEACETQSSEELSEVAADGPGDTIYSIDALCEELLVSKLGKLAAALGGVVLIAEGIENGHTVLPAGRGNSHDAAWRFLIDPIDGTRGLVYQKRSAWVLIGVAPNRGPQTNLSDIEVAVQVEIPTLKQHLCDELWATRGGGAHLQRFNRLDRTSRNLPLRPSRAPGLAHGFAMLTRFFPGARDILAQMDDEIMLEVLGPPPEGKALCFEEQYASTGGQLYELAVGHDRFNADLRPLMAATLQDRGLDQGLCCHPYDLACLLIAQEAGILVTAPDGNALDAPLDTSTNVAWVGYANREIQKLVQPALRGALKRRGLI